MCLCSGQTLLIWPTMCSPSRPRTRCWGEPWPLSRRYTTPTAGWASDQSFSPLLLGNHTFHSKITSFRQFTIWTKRSGSDFFLIFQTYTRQDLIVKYLIHSHVRDMLGSKGYGTSANVTIVPYPRIEPLTWDQAETRLFPENPVRYFATLLKLETNLRKV